MRITIALILIALACAPCFAQQRDTPYKRPAFWVSQAVEVGGMVFDFSTQKSAERRGAFEGNGFLRDSSGRLSGVRYWTVDALTSAVLLAVESRWPRWRWVAFTVRVGDGGRHFVVGFHNQRLVR